MTPLSAPRQVVCLAPLTWFLAPALDMDQLLARNANTIDFDGGFAMGASAQAAWYPEGTLFEAQMLRRAIAPLGSLPGVDEAWRATRAQIAQGKHYQFEASGGIWHVHHRFAPDFAANPFVGKRWRMHVLADGATSTLDIDGADLEAAFRVMPLLNGRHSLEQVVEAIADLPPARRLLSFAAEAGLLECSKAPRPDSVQASEPGFRFLGHAGIAVREDACTVLVDPCVSAKCGEAESVISLLNQARAVVISHHHWDHLHFQTLVRIPRDTLVVVPKISFPTWMNPPMAVWLRSLGFRNVVEIKPGDSMDIGSVRLKTAPFRGEPFGLDSTFDAFIYRLELAGWSLVGTVDACHDERGAMDAILAAAVDWKQPELLLFGCTGQTHHPAFAAAGLRHFSNELARRTDLIRYHPDAQDVRRWIAHLQPVLAAPYADFVLAPGAAELTPWTRACQNADNKLEAARQHMTCTPEKLAMLRSLCTEHTRITCFSPLDGITMG